MYLVNQIARYFVGVVFIFSGLIKLNDPIGTQIKLEEYFEVFASDVPALAGFFHTLIPLTLYLAVILCVAEVVLGVAVLVRYKMKYTLWILLLLILFFTFLTFYSAYFNKVTDCGCFGDAIKLTPWQSFFKDIVLLLFILLLFVQRPGLDSGEVTTRKSTAIMAFTVIASIAVAFYTVNYLPLIDFLPYKRNANLPALMKPSERLRYKYKLEKDGKIVEFEQYPSDTTYVFKEMVLLNPEAQPKVTDFAVWNAEGDFTQQVFVGKKLLILIQNVQKADVKAIREINSLITSLKGTNIEPIILTASDEASFEEFRHQHQIGIPYYFTDATVLKTMIRTNPGILLLENGTIRGKWPAADLPDAGMVKSLLM